MDHYLQYSENDFLMDEDFRRWVKEPSPDSDNFWHHFLLTHPHKKPEVDRAKLLLHSIIFDGNLIASEKESLWQAIAKETVAKRKEGKLVFMPNFRRPTSRRYISIVLTAFVASVVIGAFLLLRTRVPEVKVATNYGEIRQVVLPDSSIVILNARTNIRYRESWQSGDPRDVWVDGEAFFSVRHTSSNQRFVVHTNETDIEVVGTEFNVMQRNDKVQVSLNAGKIRLNISDQKGIASMAPGDIVEVSSGILKRKSGSVENISVWKEHKLIFDDTPLSEILLQLQFIYGWQRGEIDQDLLTERLTGEVETRDEQRLITTLEKALRISISKTGNIVKITRQ